MGGSSGASFAPGLEGVVAAETRISGVDGEAGVLTLAGFPVEEISGRVTFEEMVYLLRHDELPDAGELAAFRTALAGRRGLPGATLELLRAAAARKVPEMDALRMAVDTSSLDLSDDPALDLVARFPVIVAVYHRLLRDEEPVAPDPSLGHAANYLYMLGGDGPWKPTSTPSRTTA